MRKGIIAIYDKELEYARSFMDYINETSHFNMETIVFTSIDKLKEFVLDNTIEILLLDELPEDLDLVHVKNLFILSEGKSANEEDEILRVYKYQSMESIMKEIIEHYNKKAFKLESSKLNRNQTNASIIGIFSPENSSYKEILGVAVAQAFAKQKKTLLLNLELFSSTYLTDQDKKISNLSEIIYLVKEKSSEFVLYLNESIYKYGNIDCVLPVEHYSDLYELEEGDIQQLIGELKCNSNYEVIILILDFINKTTIDIMELCEKIYVPTNNSIFTKSKEKSFSHMLKLEQRDYINERFVSIQLPSSIVNDELTLSPSNDLSTIVTNMVCE